MPDTTSAEHVVNLKALIARVEADFKPSKKFPFGRFGGDIEGHLRVAEAHLRAIVGEDRKENPDLAVVGQIAEKAAPVVEKAVEAAVEAEVPDGAEVVHVAEEAVADAGKAVGDFGPDIKPPPVGGVGTPSD